MESQETSSDAQAWEPEYTPPPELKKSKVPLVIGLAALLVIAVIAVVILIKILPLLLGGKPDAPALMPANMAVYASVKADLGDLAGFKHLAEIYGDIGEVEDALDELQDELDDTMDITWEDDIQPWLGTEVAVAFSELQAVIEGSDEPTVVVMAQTRNKRASDDFLEKVVEYFEDEDWAVDEDSYEGVDYYVLEPQYEYDPTLYLGTVKDFLVLATDEDAMEDVIDASKGRADSLEDNERFNDVMSALPSDAVAYVIMDMEEIMADVADEVEQELDYQGLSLPREITDLYETFGAYGLALGVHEDGIQLDAAVSFDPDKMDTELFAAYQTKASPNRILSWIPEDALGFYSGQNLAAVWRVAYNLLMEVPDAEEQIKDLSDEVGIRLDEELLSWMSGEFAVAVVESGNLEDVPVGGFAVFEVDDEDEAQALLEDIRDALEELGDIEIDEDTIGGVDMTLIIDPSMEEVILGYGFDDRHLIVGFTEDGLGEAVGDAKSITGHDSFKAVQKRLPSKATGYLYVNLEEVMSVVLDTMSEYERRDYEDYTEPFIEPIKAIGLAAEPMDMGKGIAHTTFFVYIP